MSTLMVQGTSSGAGKTTMVAALCRIFADRGYSVAPFKSQNMSRYAYTTDKFEIAVAQAVQAVAARCEIMPDLNPILLKPLDDYHSQVYLLGRSYKRMHAADYYTKFALTGGLETALGSLGRLQKKHDLVIIEGAGSPAEINVAEWDIANMRIAGHAGSPVLLVADIERGGSFASIAGTMLLLEDRYRELVKGFIFNKFRGDMEILKPGFERLERETGRPVLGTVPMLDVAIPEEDSMGSRPGRSMKDLSHIDADLDRLSGAVEKSLDIGAIEGMISW
ncbi:Probable cobyric acid synthase [Geodia barretti]|uniref:Probable cobyric acid synthase n=2 Tax=Geodia barretti TaxID=519541 RepID=A0AA35X678_GEOBA|nr:Probable cobyric acid synthase [Geodia barretti]